MPEPGSSHFTVYIGGETKELTEGHARLELQATDEHCDALGRVHTGVLTSLMDTVIGMALSCLRGGFDSGQATIDMHSNFMAPAVPGDELVCEGRVTYIDEAMALGDVETRRRSDGKLLAKAQVTYALLKRAPEVGAP